MKPRLLDLYSYTDSDWISSQDNKTSTTGCMIFGGKCDLTGHHLNKGWLPVEVEHRALANGSGEIMWFYLA